MGAISLYVMSSNNDTTDEKVDFTKVYFPITYRYNIHRVSLKTLAYNFKKNVTPR